MSTSTLQLICALPIWTFTTLIRCDVIYRLSRQMFNPVLYNPNATSSVASTGVSLAWVSQLPTHFICDNRALYDGRIWPLFWQWWHVAFLNLHDSDRSCILPHDLHLSGLLLLCSTLHQEMACWTFAALQLAESLMCTIFAFLAISSVIHLSCAVA